MRPDRLLNHLVVTSLTIFVTLLILMGAILFRQIRLQQTVIETNEVLQLTIDDLEETTQDLQDELLEIQTGDDPSLEAVSWEDVDGLLDDVDEQLDTIEQGIGDIELALDNSTDERLASEDISQEGVVAIDQADHLFTMLALLVGITSIMFAIFLTVAIRLQQELPFGLGWANITTILDSSNPNT